MSDTALKTVWEYYDAARHAGKGGNYMFLLKAFGNAPYYSGETQDFEDRFTRNRTSHEKLFHDGMRTFMRKPFMDECTDRTHSGFASRWDYYKQQSAAEGERLVWVPTGSPNDAMACICRQLFANATSEMPKRLANVLIGADQARS